MKRIIYLSLVAFLIVLGCSKTDDFAVNQDENQLKSATVNSSEESQSIASSVVESCELLSVEEKPNHPALKISEGETMVHIIFTSSGYLENAIVEITLPQILKYRIGPGSGYREDLFTPNNIDQPTVITWVGDLASCTPKIFCIIVKPNCNASGKAVIWSDFKVNGVSKKGTIKNKVFVCN